MYFIKITGKHGGSVEFASIAERNRSKNWKMSERDKINSGEQGKIKLISNIRLFKGLVLCAFEVNESLIHFSSAPTVTAKQ